MTGPDRQNRPRPSLTPPPFILQDEHPTPSPPLPIPVIPVVRPFIFAAHQPLLPVVDSFAVVDVLVDVHDA
jgi:hypothetical protein